MRRRWTPRDKGLNSPPFDPREALSRPRPSRAAMQLSSVAVIVKDRAKASRWYEEKLGFEVRDEHGHWVTVAPKGSDVVIHLCDEFYDLEPGNTGISFTTKNVARVQKQFEKKGVKFTKATSTEDWGTYAMFADPDGNEYWLIED